MISCVAQPKVSDTDAASDTGVVADADADGFGADVDCDDSDAAVHPEAVEVCDGADNNCDGEIDEDAADAVAWYADADGDGFGDPAAVSLACAPASGEQDSGEDCDDTDAAIHPGAVEVCGDGIDQDCDPASVGCEASTSPLATGSSGAVLGAALLGDLQLAASAELEVAIGAAGANSGSGRVDIYSVASDGSTTSVAAISGPAGSSAGAALASAGGATVGSDTLYIGAVFEDQGLPGQAYGIVGPISGSLSLPADADWVLIGGEDGDHFGRAIARPDLDGDGADDLVIGASHEDTAGHGRVYAFQGHFPSVSQYAEVAASAIITNTEPASLFGRDVAHGEINGDGVDDLIIGAPGAGADAGSPLPGSVYTRCGAIPTTDTESFTLDAADQLSGSSVGASGGDFFGADVEVGDIDGDGADDLAVTSWFYGSGAVWLVQSNGDCTHNPSASSRWDADGDAAMSLRVADVDGDGALDLLVGQRGSDVGGEDSGAVTVLFGPLDMSGRVGDLGAPAAGEGVLMAGVTAGAHFGVVAVAGDIDADGDQEILVGSPLRDGRSGAVHLLLGPGE